VTGALALATAVAAGLRPTLAGGAERGLLAAVLVVAVGFLAANLAVGAAGGIPWAIGAVAAEYVAWLALGRADLDLWSPAVGAALLASADLSYWSLDLRWPSRDDRRIHLARAGRLAALLAGGVALGALPLVAAIVSFGGFAAAIAGAAAVPAALALAVLLARRTRHRAEAGG
jgi:hypothetical protein